MHFTFIIALVFFIACIAGYFFLMRKYKIEKKKINKKIKWKKDNELTEEVEFYKTDRPTDINTKSPEQLP